MITETKGCKSNGRESKMTKFKAINPRKTLKSITVSTNWKDICKNTYGSMWTSWTKSFRLFRTKFWQTMTNTCWENCQPTLNPKDLMTIHKKPMSHLLARRWQEKMIHLCSIKAWTTTMTSWCENFRKRGIKMCKPIWSTSRKWIKMRLMENTRLSQKSLWYELLRF